MFNICRLEDVIDKPNSVVECRDSGLIRHIDKIAFKDYETIPFGLARASLFRPIMVASPEVAKAFKKNKIRGMKFLTDAEAY